MPPFLCVHSFRCVANTQENGAKGFFFHSLLSLLVLVYYLHTFDVVVASNGKNMCSLSQYMITFFVLFCTFSKNVNVCFFRANMIISIINFISSITVISLLPQNSHCLNIRILSIVIKMINITMCNRKEKRKTNDQQK